MSDILLLYVCLPFFACFAAFMVTIYLSIKKKKKFNFNGKHAFITGGSKGIGKEIALSLIRRGCSVTIVARDKNFLESAVSNMSSLAKSLKSDAMVQSFVLDVTAGFTEIEKVVRESEHSFGPIDILVSNVGSVVHSAFDTIPLEDFDYIMKLNFFSAVHVTRAVLPSMKKSGGGVITFVCSAAAQCPIWGYTAYVASKLALKGFAESLHMELQVYDILVNLFYPPNTDTDGFEAECKTMPEIVKIISGAAGLYSPNYVAEQLINDLGKGNTRTSIGLEGWMLSILSAGSSPETNFFRAFCQVLLGGLMRGVMLIYMGHFRRVVERFSGKTIQERTLSQR